MIFSVLNRSIKLINKNNLIQKSSIYSILKSPFNRRSFSETNLDINTNVVKDVILYKYDNPRFFKYLNIFALSQFGFWMYFSYFSYNEMKDAPPPPARKDDSTLAWWRKINLGESKYRSALSVISFFIGYGILAVAWLYTLKSVRYLVLRKGGKEVSFVTYTPFGTNRILTVNLKHVNCAQSRAFAKTYLPIKVQNLYLQYLLDMKGEFKNQQLFDHTAGLKRSFKKM